MQRLIFPTSGPWTTYRLDKKILPDWMSLGHPKKMWQWNWSLIWPSPLRQGEVDEWFMHKIHTATHTQYTHTHMSSPLYGHTPTPMSTMIYICTHISNAIFYHTKGPQCHGGGGEVPGRPGFRSSHTKDFKNGTWYHLA